MAPVAQPGRTAAAVSVRLVSPRHHLRCAGGSARPNASFRADFRMAGPPPWAAVFASPSFFFAQYSAPLYSTSLSNLLNKLDLLIGVCLTSDAGDYGRVSGTIHGATD